MTSLKKKTQEKDVTSCEVTFSPMTSGQGPVTSLPVVLPPQMLLCPSLYTADVMLECPLK